MTKVQSLKSFKNSKRSNELETRISDLAELAKIEFEGHISTQKIVGNWDDISWKYQNLNLWFTKLYDLDGQLINSKSKGESRVALPSFFIELARLFALKRINKNATKKTTSDGLVALTYFFEACNYDLNEISSLRQASLTKVRELIEEEASSQSSAYEKYKVVLGFVRQILIPNHLCPKFDVKNNMPNPRSRSLDKTNQNYEGRKEKKYDEMIDRYIAVAKRRYDADLDAIARGDEPVYARPKPVTHELRFLAIPFFMAFGLRVGELCRLPRDCLQYDEVNEKWYLKVLTEKGQLPSARPVPRVWEKIIKDSYDRIIELTQEAREFTKKIEKKGAQAFIDRLTFPNRDPLVDQGLSQLGYDPENYFLRSEIGKAGDVHSSGLTYNALRDKGVFGESIVDTVKMSRDKGRHIAVLESKIHSKRRVGELALQFFNESRQRIYAENQTDGESNQKYSSDSFEENMPFSEHLFLVYETTFNIAKNSQGFIPVPMTARNIYRWMTSDTSRSKSIFEVYDVRDEDGNIVKITSHQFRHWLTTAIIRSGKNESMIDLFMGRSTGQTRHYDHRTSKERAEGLREKYLSDNVPNDALGRRVERMRKNSVSLDKIESMINHTLQVAHFTPWGLCWRDLDVTPCEKGMMCVRGKDGQGCGHFGIDPDDLEAKKSIHNTKTHYENQLSILMPNYESLRHELNADEPLDQHIQFCIETIDGCTNALAAYDRYQENKSNQIDIVQVFPSTEGEV